jgi:hypothetical protein
MKLPRCINMKVALADYIPVSSTHHKSLLKLPNRIASTEAHMPKANLRRSISMSLITKSTGPTTASYIHM